MSRHLPNRRWWLMLGTMVAALPAAALELGPGEWLERLNMYTPDEQAPAYKREAFERFGTQWAGSLGFAAWQSHHTDLGERSRQYMYCDLVLLQRLCEDKENGGTWLHVSFSSCRGLNYRSHHKVGLGEQASADAARQWEDDKKYNFGIPALSLLQYFNHKQTSVSVGMLDAGHSFDYCCTAGDFADSAIAGTSVLPLTSGNLAVQVQQELGCNNYIQVAGGRSGCEYASHNNPFRSRYCKGSVFVAEYGHWLRDTTELRLAGYYRHIDRRLSKGGERDAVGILTSIDTDLTDNVSFFARVGVGTPQQEDVPAECSFGFQFYLLENCPEDFLGIGASVVKGCPRYGRYNEQNVPTGGQNHRREYVLEAAYSYRLNKHLYVVPHAEYIFHPSYAATPSECLIGTQVTLCF